MNKSFSSLLVKCQFEQDFIIYVFTVAQYWSLDEKGKPKDSHSISQPGHSWKSHSRSRYFGWPSKSDQIMVHVWEMNTRDVNIFFVFRMVMRFVLWAMRHLGSFLLWILKGMNCLIRSSVFHFLYNIMIIKRNMCWLFIIFFMLWFRPWLKIKVTNGLPSITNRRPQRKMHSSSVPLDNKC